MTINHDSFAIKLERTTFQLVGNYRHIAIQLTTIFALSSYHHIVLKTFEYKSIILRNEEALNFNSSSYKPVHFTWIFESYLFMNTDSLFTWCLKSLIVSILSLPELLILILATGLAFMVPLVRSKNVFHFLGLRINNRILRRGTIVCMVQIAYGRSTINTNNFTINAIMGQIHLEWPCKALSF
jgi:hypothetical protein